MKRIPNTFLLLAPDCDLVLAAVLLPRSCSPCPSEFQSNRPCRGCSGRAVEAAANTPPNAALIYIEGQVALAGPVACALFPFLPVTAAA